MSAKAPELRVGIMSPRQLILTAIGTTLFYSGNGILFVSSVYAVHRITGLILKGMDLLTRLCFPLTTGDRRIDQPIPIGVPFPWHSVIRELEDHVAIGFTLVVGLAIRSFGGWFNRQGRLAD